MKKSALVVVSLLFVVFLFAACASPTYRCSDNGCKMEIINDGYSVRITTSDGKVYSGDAYGDSFIQKSYVNLDGYVYMFRNSKDQKIVWVTTETTGATDVLGIAGTYKK